MHESVHGWCMGAWGWWRVGGFVNDVFKLVNGVHLVRDIPMAHGVPTKTSSFREK